MVAVCSRGLRDATFSPMTTVLRRIRTAVTLLGAETRPEFKRVDVSPARYDDGSWLKPKS
jgi:hypothetical protein